MNTGLIYTVMIRGGHPVSNLRPLPSHGTDHVLGLPGDGPRDLHETGPISLLPTLGRLFWPVRRKNSAAEGKIGPLAFFSFSRRFLPLKKSYLCLLQYEKYNIS
jgi:hypothetical protein